MHSTKVDKIMRRVQSLTRRTADRTPPQEILSDSDVDTSKDLVATPKGLKTSSSRFGSGRVFAVLKSSRSKSLSRLDSLPGDIPHGCLAVYVGNERRRFVISTKYLSHQLFKALLKKCEEEFGFHHQGGLTIACDPVLFEHLLWLIGTNNPAARTTQLEELLDFYS